MNRGAVACDSLGCSAAKPISIKLSGEAAKIQARRASECVPGIVKLRSVGHTRLRVVLVFAGPSARNGLNLMLMGSAALHPRLMHAAASRLFIHLDSPWTMVPTYGMAYYFFNAFLIAATAC